MANDLKSLGLNIARVRKLRGWTQKKLADEAGLTQGMISNYESGKIEDVSVGSVRALARAMKVPPSSLMGDEDLKLEVISRELTEEEKAADTLGRYSLDAKRKALALLALTAEPDLLDIMHIAFSAYLPVIEGSASNNKKPSSG